MQKCKPEQFADREEQRVFEELRQAAKQPRDTSAAKVVKKQIPTLQKEFKAAKVEKEKRVAVTDSTVTQEELDDSMID